MLFIHIQELTSNRDPNIFCRQSLLSYELFEYLYHLRQQKRDVSYKGQNREKLLQTFRKIPSMVLPKYMEIRLTIAGSCILDIILCIVVLNISLNIGKE